MPTFRDHSSKIISSENDHMHFFYYYYVLDLIIHDTKLVV